MLGEENKYTLLRAFDSEKVDSTEVIVEEDSVEDEDEDNDDEDDEEGLGDDLES